MHKAGEEVKRKSSQQQSPVLLNEKIAGCSSIRSLSSLAEKMGRGLLKRSPANSVLNSTASERRDVAFAQIHIHEAAEAHDTTQLALQECSLLQEGCDDGSSEE